MQLFRLISNILGLPLLLALSIGHFGIAFGWWDIEPVPPIGIALLALSIVLFMLSELIRASRGE